MSLKDALLKAGLKSSTAPNERKAEKFQKKKKIEKHQHARNYCEACKFTQPDVEKFDHRNRLLDARWICSNCADKLELLDDFRVTNQSQFAKQGKYRRQYGHTKRFPKSGIDTRSSQRSNKNSTNSKRNNKNYNFSNDKNGNR